MKIREIKENKKQFLSLLLLADEQENMIDRYLERGTMYVLNDNGVKAECVVTDEGNGILEIKNIATVPEYQGNFSTVNILYEKPKHRRDLCLIRAFIPYSLKKMKLPTR